METNKLAVITGGSKGIGKAIIEKLMAEGFDIITASRTDTLLQRLEMELMVDYPQQRFHYISADLSKKEDVERFAAFISGFDRKIDILVNNAGLFVPGAIHSEEEGQLELMINTNLYSAYHLTRALIGLMLREKSGHIFNICSTASITPYTNGGSYCISKYALYGMTKVLREEMKPFGIKVTAVLPGATRTASWDGVDLPEERFMKADDVAEVIFSAYSLSNAAVVEEILLRPQDGDIS